VDGLRCVINAQRSAGDALTQEKMWLAESFAIADRDGDGQLDRREVATLLNSLNVSPADSNIIKQRAHADKLDFDEFVQLYNQLSRRQLRLSHT